MGKMLTFEYDDVKKFSKTFNNRIKPNKVERMFENICERAMENTTTNAKKFVTERTERYSGELEDGWGKKAKVEATKRTGKVYVKTVTNEAFNPRAEEDNMNPHYASFVEEGHDKVPWRKGTHGIHALADAEIDTERKLQGIVEDEMKKLFGGLFD